MLTSQISLLQGYSDPGSAGGDGGERGQGPGRQLGCPRQGGQEAQRQRHAGRRQAQGAGDSCGAYDQATERRMNTCIGAVHTLFGSVIKQTLVEWLSVLDFSRLQQRRLMSKGLK